MSIDNIISDPKKLTWQEQLFLMRVRHFEKSRRRNIQTIDDFYLAFNMAKRLRRSNVDYILRFATDPDKAEIFRMGLLP